MVKPFACALACVVVVVTSGVNTMVFPDRVGTRVCVCTGVGVLIRVCVCRTSVEGLMTEDGAIMGAVVVLLRRLRLAGCSI